MESSRQMQLRTQSTAVVVGVLIFQLQVLDQWLQEREDEAAASRYRYRPGVPTSLYDVGRGAREVDVMLNYDEQYCRSTTRLTQDVLRALIEKVREYGITDTNLSVAEKVVIFLDYCAHKKTYQELRRIYQHSDLTFTRHIKAVGIALTRMFKETIRNQPSLTLHPSISDNDRYGPYFKGCVGAIDGSHIPVRLTKVDQANWRNRKGFQSQNVMFACDFDMYITWVQPGFEGSAHDGTVLKRAEEQGFDIPTSHYYLGDGGYSKKHRMLLVPYQRTRYHLREITDAAKRPETKEELFNLRHARLRNCIERLIGVMKRRWRGLRDGPEIGFTVRQQMLFVWALAAVHNFALTQGISVDEDERLLAQESDMTQGDTVPTDEDSAIELGIEALDESPLDNRGMTGFRDRLAQKMWDDYIQDTSSRRGSR